MTKTLLGLWAALIVAACVAVPFTDGPDPVGNEFIVTIEEIPNETPVTAKIDACQLMADCVKGRKTVCNYYMINYQWYCRCRVTKEKC